MLKQLTLKRNKIKWVKTNKTAADSQELISRAGSKTFIESLPKSCLPIEPRGPNLRALPVTLMYWKNSSQLHDTFELNL